MARQNPSDNGANQAMVFDNLGLSSDDLGMGDNEDVSLQDDASDDSQDDDQHLGPDDGDDLSSELDRFEQSRQRQPDQRRQRDRSGLDNLASKGRLPKTAEVKPDGKGNLVNAQGQIVARAGKEARFYQDRVKAQKDLTTTQLRVTDLSSKLQRAVEIGKGIHAELSKLQAANEQISKLGVKPEQMMLALSLFRDLDQKPAETLRKLLTRAQANGIQVQDQGGGGNGNQNGSMGLFGSNQPALAEVITEAVSKQLAPFQELLKGQQTNEAARQKDQQSQQEVQNEVNQWFMTNPDALEYAPVIQRMLQNPANRNRSLGELWLEIQLNLSRRGGVQRGNGTPRRGRAPMAGRGMPPEGNSDMAPVNETYDSIIRDVMNEHGIR